MKALRLIFAGLVLFLMVLSIEPAKSQCAMCSAQVETNAKSGSKATHGLNNGVLLLLAAPYLAAGCVGYIWYKNYRRKNVDLKMRNEKLNLN